MPQGLRKPSGERDERRDEDQDALLGYAGIATDSQDLTAQRSALTVLGVIDERICVDRGLTGINRDRPGCVEAWPLAAPATRCHH